jgi:hypothetical protein
MGEFLAQTGLFLVMLPAMALGIFGLIRVAQMRRDDRWRAGPKFRVESRLAWLPVLAWVLFALLVGAAFVLR